jgi:K+-sensing histidine kinase KdpD
MEETAPPQLLALSALAGVALGLMLTATWQSAPDATLRLALLTAAGAAGALVVATRPRDRGLPAAEERERAPDNPSRLLAQMHHELRTPLNAMIGLSEVMQRELHGPLGHARYQEYAAHISESGERLLKASEDAIAVAATMSALLAERGGPRRERRPAAQLVREAWTALLDGPCDIALSVEGCAAIEVDCDREATAQALQHLLGEAVTHATRGGTIAASASGSATLRRIEISVGPARPEDERGPGAAGGRRRREEGGYPAPGDGVRLILARSLLEMQGSTLTLRTEPEARGWSAAMVFAVATARPRRRRRHPSAADRRPAAPARRGDFPAGAAARASAGSHAAPPA